MATKTITTTVTLHKPGKKHKPFEIADNGSRKSGHYDPEIVPPGGQIELDADEADDILKRFGGEEVTADGKKVVDPAVVQPPKITSDPGKPAGAKA